MSKVNIKILKNFTTNIKILPSEMSTNKVTKFLNNNIILLVGIPLIVTVHWTWWKLQQNPALVDTSQKKEFPIIAASKRYYDWFLDRDPHERQRTTVTK